MLDKSLKLDEYIVKVAPMKRIGEVFAKNQLNILHGIQGSGKSYSCIKALNMDGIVPVHVNLDASAGLEDLVTYNVEMEFLRNFLNLQFKKDFFKDQVILLDTYIRLEHAIFSRGRITTKNGVFRLLEDTQKHYQGITIIVIGHTQPFVGRDGIFNDNLSLVRGAAEELWLEKLNFKGTIKVKPHSKYVLHICKARGFNGDRDIPNWMRD